MEDGAAPPEPAPPSDIPSPDRQEGSVQRYIEDKGFGFITRTDAPSLFFHANNLECSIPYEGETLTFTLGKDKTGRDEARSLRRPSSDLRTGDIIDWRVEPGTRHGEGLIFPHGGTDPIPFSGHDLRRSPGLRQPSPRPWHAAKYQTILLKDKTLRAVDIDIDWRYPLQRFAFLGKEEDVIVRLKGLALDENWDYRTSKSRKPHEILYSYLQFTFAKLVDEDRRRAASDRKVRTRTDLKDHKPLATFNTGLVDKRYESIFALFEANEPGRQQPWVFLDFCIPGEDAGKLLSRHFNPLPGPACYFTHASELLFDPDAPLHPDYTHILNENRDRLPADLLATVEKLDSRRAENTLKMHLDRAINLARKRTRWNFKTAIPHYFPSFRRLDFLLPLCLLDDTTVDGALAVQPTETGYIGNTILPLDWAYKSARLVCRPDSDWLAPDRIDSGADVSLDEAPDAAD